METEDMNDQNRRGYDRRLLAHKVKWEGGVLNTLSNGTRSGEIADADLAIRWAEIEALYGQLMPKVAELERSLGAAA